MKIIQKNKLNMFVSVQAVLKKYAKVIAAITALNLAVEVFFTMLTGLKGLVETGEKNNKGFTKTKASKKEAMADFASSLAKAGRAYAFDTDKKALFTILDHSKWDIQHAPDNISVELSNLILNEIKEILPQLSNYLVEQADVDYLGKLIEDYVNSHEDKVTVNTKSVVSTSEMSIKFKEITDYLNNKLDALMIRIKDKQPELFKEYLQARNIYDLGVHHGTSSDVVENKT